eukprot:scaffold411744_cov26-Prasinocladus_malaysianus.AAC.1
MSIWMIALRQADGSRHVPVMDRLGTFSIYGYGLVLKLSIVPHVTTAANAPCNTKSPRQLISQHSTTYTHASVLKQAWQRPSPLQNQHDSMVWYFACGIWVELL